MIMLINDVHDVTTIYDDTEGDNNLRSLNFDPSQNLHRRIFKMTTKRNVEEIRIKVPWGHVAAKAWGSPKSPPVLVAHGILDNAGSFDRIMPMLPDNFYYVVIDLPGHGFSSSLPQGIQLDYMNYVLAIRLVLDELKWDKCIYLGHSLGSQLGVFTCVMNPGRITKLICLDGFAPTPTDKDLLFFMRTIQDTAVQALHAQSPPLYTKDEILYALKSKRQFPLSSAAAEALMKRSITKVGDLYMYNRDYRLRTLINPLLNFGQLTEIMRRINVPVLIVLASASWLTSGYINILKNISKPLNARVVTVPGNHDVHNNNPEVVAPHVSSFLNNAGVSKL